MTAGLEAQRQQALLAALAAHPGEIPSEPTAALALEQLARGPRTARGLAAYRANGTASAERALAAVFGTVQAMLGVDDFRQLSREFWRADPPQRGDLAEWGGALPDWIAGHPGLDAWPYLADTARLDLARHGCERAADAALDVTSLALLESTDPAQLRLAPMPGMTVLRSAWPMAAIHAAHQAQAGGDAAFAAVRDAMAAQRADTVLIARRGWRAEVHSLSVTEAGWMDDLLAGASLANAFDRAGAAFDFAAWLGVALREPWVKGVARTRD